MNPIIGRQKSVSMGDRAIGRFTQCNRLRALSVDKVIDGMSPAIRIALSGGIQSILRSNVEPRTFLEKHHQREMGNPIFGARPVKTTVLQNS